MLLLTHFVICFVLLRQLQLGDIVISVETARRQAEERGHTLLDEIRILMVGLFSSLYFLIMFNSNFSNCINGSIVVSLLSDLSI